MIRKSCMENTAVWPLCKWLIQAMQKSADSPPCDWIPAVHAGMTSFNHLCITISGLRGSANLNAGENQRCLNLICCKQI